MCHLCIPMCGDLLVRQAAVRRHSISGIIVIELVCIVDVSYRAVDTKPLVSMIKQFCVNIS